MNIPILINKQMSDERHCTNSFRKIPIFVEENMNICNTEISPKQSILRPDKLETKPPMGTLTINRRKIRQKDIKRKSIGTDDLSDGTNGHGDQIYEYMEARILF